jgi:aspartokinase-like uncharacterized kinase
MDAVIKIGGSLAEDPERLRALCHKLSELAKEYAIIVVPGGGRFADVVRDFDQRFTLSNDVSHRMAILGMYQFGLLLSDIMPNSRVFHRLERGKDLGEAKTAPIFLPLNLMFEEDPFENSWDVTSDSIAAYVANRLHARKVVLATDVDGIFTSNPKKNSDAKLIKRMSAKKLLSSNQRTSVDTFLPKLLLEVKIDCYVVNGKYPARVEAILTGQRTTCTLIATRTE